MLPGRAGADRNYVNQGTELRHQVARSLEQQAAPIVNDAVAVFPFTGVEGSDPDSHNRLAALILQLLALAAREGELDPRSDAITDLRHAAERQHVTVRQLFGLVYLVERAALDELALDESFGATSEPWPALAQTVRRSSFSLLAAYAERLNREPGRDALTDALTTLHTRAVLAAATDKEIQRSERFGHPFAIIVVDIDRLSEINARHGYGSGDRVLERLGILMRNYFREQDWVGRFSGDGFAVLLPETHREHAVLLAERVRTTVESRMALHDYRSEEEVPVTVSVGVVFVESVDRTVRAEQLFDEVRQAVHRAKLAGRNRVETVDISIARPATPPPRDVNPL
jgi:diguanylate cyclase (GGDEF)-like protein